MRELLVVLVVIAVIAIIWYLRKESEKSAEQRKVDEFRRLQAAANEADRASLTAAATAPAAPPRASRPGLAERGAGLFQEAADSAAGRQYEKAADQMEEMTADLAAARRDAERAAEQLASRAAEALASIQAAAASHGGAVPGDGTRDCPSGYPIKGNMASMRYHTPGQPSYNRTIPEVCFQNGEAAEAAGFTESGDEAGMRSGAVVVGEVVVDGERVDVVAEAIAAADAGGVPPGAIRGDGSRDCPPGYPIKGNQSTMIYHEPGTPTYLSTLPELCFSNADVARTAGYSPTRH